MQAKQPVPSFAATCRNCGAELTGEFCARCGQGHRHERLRVRDWVADAFDAATSLESRILKTVIGLSLRPGQTVREYVDGRRIPYVTPLRYAVATCALWWLAVSLSGDGSASAELSFIVRYGQIINLVSVPLLAPFVQLAFLGSGYRFAEYLCFMFFVSGHLFLWRVGEVLVGLIPGTSGLVISSVDTLFYLAYMSWALWGFHRGRVKWLPLRAAFALLGTVAFGAALNIGIGMLARAF